MKKSVLITVGLTCFNGQCTIARAIESAAKQEWPNFEIIIVDDNSSDDSVRIIQDIQDKDKRINLYRHKKNLGYPAALNTIVKYAKGDYIAFFDDDDHSETDRLTKQYKRLSQFQTHHPDAPVLCYAHRRVFIEGEEKHDAFVNAIGARSPEPHGVMVADYLLWHREAKGYVWGEFGSCTLMASTETFKKFYFDAQFRRSAEWDFAIRVALKGGHFISVDEPLILQHKTQTSDKAGRKPLDYALMLRRKHKKYLRKNLVYAGAILQAYARFYYFRGKPWKSRLCLALACLLSPTKIMAEVITKRTSGKDNSI